MRKLMLNEVRTIVKLLVEHRPSHSPEAVRGHLVVGIPHRP